MGLAEWVGWRCAPDGDDRMVVDGTCVKVLARYDNEIGYVNRLIELAQKVGAML